MNKKIHFSLLTSLTVLVMVVSALHPMIARADDSTPSAPAVVATQPPAADTSAPAVVATQPPAADTSAPAVVVTQPPAADTSAPAVVATQPPAADTSVAPASTSVAADTSVAPADTSAAPASTSVSSTDTSVAPAATSAVPVSTSVTPADTSVAPVDTSVAPASTATTSSATTVGPTDTTVALTDTTVAPADTSTLVGLVPIGTPVVVLDATGTVVPLATQAAADIIKTGDPVWCPTGKTPAGGIAAGCTNNEDSLTALISDLTSPSYSGEGTIYIASDYDASTSGAAAADNGQDITFDYGNVSLTDLTVQGGWDFTSDTHTTGTISNLTGINSLNFIDWGGYGAPASLTINDITIDGGGKSGGSGFYGSTLYVGPANDTPSGDVALNNVSVTNGAGADVETVSGGVGTSSGVTMAGDIKINKRNPADKSNFSGNTGTNDGLYASSAGSFDASNVTANGNGGNGLEVYSNGAITLTDVIADNNGQSGSGSGAVLDNHTASSAQNISVNTLSGSIYNDFSNNYNNGLEALSLGNISLNAVDAYNNGWGSGAGGTGDGAYLENDYGDTGTIFVYFGNFGLNDSSPTYGNGSNGLEADSNSSIDLEAVNANYNNYDGALLQTTGKDANGASIYVDQINSPSSFTVSSFDNNLGNGTSLHPAGLEADGPGDFGIWNVNAQCNGQSDCSLPLSGSVDGLYLDNAYGSGSISVDDSLDLGQFSSNSNNGLEAQSNGAITLTDVVASSNTGGDGAYLNTFHGSPASTVTVDNSHIIGGDGFNGNGEDGLDVISSGTITLNSVVADNNNYDGAYLTTTGSDGSPNFDASIYIDADSGGLEGSYSDFNSNLGEQPGPITATNNPSGLEAYGPGTIVLANVDAECNGIPGGEVHFIAKEELIIPYSPWVVRSTVFIWITVPAAVHPTQLFVGSGLKMMFPDNFGETQPTASQPTPRVISPWMKSMQSRTTMMVPISTAANPSSSMSIPLAIPHLDLPATSATIMLPKAQV